MYPYAIGLDIGITSVGWAVLALDGSERPMGIIDMGSRIFDAAEHPQTGASLAAPRREKRSLRRRLRRHRHRNERIRNLITECLLSENELNSLYDGKISDIYELRVRALDEPLTKMELARIMIHISQRRGFKSNRKNANDAEDGRLLEAVNKNAARMEDCGYRTVGELLLKDPVFAEHKRNKGGEYLSTVTRSLVEEEVHKIFAAQRTLGTSFASEELESRYLDILLSQRSFDEGPGGNSPYGGSQIDKMIGHCTFFPDEQRAPKASWSFEYFSLLQKVNHIRIGEESKMEPLDQAARETVIDLARKSDSVTFAQIRKALKLPDDQYFNIYYAGSPSKAEAEKKEKLNCLKSWHQIRRALDRVEKGAIKALSSDQLDAIGVILSKYKSADKIEALLREANIDERFIPALEELTFSKFGHISLKACSMLIPFMEQGMLYNEACAAAGFDFHGHDKREKSMLLKYKEKDFSDITNPVVRRAISQTIKVVNAIIRSRQCSPVYINIELAREISKRLSERNQIKNEQDKNAAINEKLKKEIESLFGILNPTGQDLVKYRLYKEQDGVCLYSLRHMAIDRLFEKGYAEVDHIVPYSISFDDSRKNKVLVFASENRDKGNRIPMHYLEGKRRDDFVIWVQNNVRDFRKRELLLKTTIDAEGFKERNLQDTKYISSFLQNYLKDNLLFAPSTSGKIKRVTAVNGAVTAYLRKRWGISKIRENGDLHHAVDAVCIACTTDSMIQRVSRYSSWKECHYTQTDKGAILSDPETGEVLTTFPYPWPDFRKELEVRLSNDPARWLADLKLPFYMDEEAPQVKPLFVSRMPKHKVTGAAHKDTIRSGKEDGFAVSKKNLTELRLKNGEILNYYRPGDDRLLYEALKERLIAFNGNAKEAFAEPFYKPRSDGTPGPLVKKVKIIEPSTLNVPVLHNTAVADNGAMIRVDIFYVSGDGYYFVPVYVADTKKAELPNRACIAHKPYTEWKEMDEKDFLFSLYPNDLVRAEHKKEIKLTRNYKDSTLPETKSAKSFLLYYAKAGIAGGSMSFILHDNSYSISGLGIKTLVKFEKYEVDVLGNLHPVKKETRQKFR